MQRLTTELGNDPFPSTKFERKIADAINKRSNIMMLGPGGTGKTYTLKRLAKWICDTIPPVDGEIGDDGEIPLPVAVTSMTGLAAYNLNIEGVLSGQTVHSWGGLGVVPDDITPEGLVGKVKRSPAYKNWSSVVYLIIDEVSMLGKNFFELIEYVARVMRGKEQDYGNGMRGSKFPFGNLKLILSGDFLQLPPVRDEFVFISDVWKEMMAFQVFLFEEPKRYPDHNYFGMLLRVRKEECTFQDFEILNSRVAAWRKYKTNPETISPIYLYPTKDQSLQHNLLNLQKLTTPEFKFLARDSFDAKNFLFSEKRKKEMMEDRIPEIITLKVGAQVMLRVNIRDPSKKLILTNGSRGIVKEINELPPSTLISQPEYIITVEWENGIVREMTTQSFKLEDKTGTYTRIQFPIELAWAFTVHKCQGFTVSSAVLDPQRTFADGQFYVAISRVRTLEGLFLVNFDPRYVKANKLAKEYMSAIEDNIDEVCLTFTQ